MEHRTVSQQYGPWRITTDVGDLDATEVAELKEYLGEAGILFSVVSGRIEIPASVSRATIFEVVEHFYDGRAEVYPF